jgi:precorrin-3B synthase
LTELSGRFLFGIDDGTGDIAALKPDVLAVVAEPPWVEGLRCDDVVAALLAAAHAFLDERAAQGSAAWRVDELTAGRTRIRRRLAASGEPAPVLRPSAAPAGVTAGRQVLLVPLGRLTAVQADWLADRLDGGDARITPWRSVVLPAPASDAELAAAEAVGFGIDRSSRWYGVSSCAGQPGCAKALADVQAEAARTAGQWQHVHFSGCARRCGRPIDTVVDVLATEDGYVIHRA